MTKVEWTPKNVPENFYRVSVKALILNETRDKFLIMQEANGKWETPGGGLDFGETPQEGIAREIAEEMHLKVSRIADQPSYFTFGTKSMLGYWNVGAVYEAELSDLDFTPTEECVALKFVGKGDEEWLKSIDKNDSVLALFKVFDPKNHQR